MRKQKRESFVHRLVDLISEPQFLGFENMLREPNIFRIVGRTHYERWHSCFWGWLLDASGSHLLGTYTLTRMLHLLVDHRCLQSSRHDEQALWSVLPTTEFTATEVVPNENISTETSVSGVGRFDIYLTTQFQDALKRTKRVNLVFELKIDSSVDAQQCKRYADWLIGSHPDDVNLLVLVTPTLLTNSRATAGDDRWYCVDYQLLNDRVLIPVLDHPSLNEKVRPFIVQYVKNLKIRYKGIKMAITDEERRMAVALYEKYSDVFDAIYDALVATGTIDQSTSGVTSAPGRESGRIAVKLDGRVFSNETLRLLIEDVLRYLVDSGLLTQLPLPWGTSSQRYLLTNEEPPKHPTGRDFFYPVRYKGITMESHYSRERGIEVLAQLAHRLDIEFERIET